MGEISEDFDYDINEARQALIELNTRFGLPATPGLDAPFPASQQGAPLIVDTDAGGDPDDAIALVAAATLPELTLVVTTDELPGGRRARFVRLLLDLLGRPEVAVVTGRDLGNTRLDCIDGLVPAEVPAQREDVVDAVTAVCDRYQGPVRWAGLGPMSNLAEVLTTRPELAERLVITQMGGALNYRDPERAEHNVRMDPEAARVVLARANQPRLVLSDVTFTPELEIRASEDLHRRLAAPQAPVWARLLAAHLGQWFTRFHPGTIQHDGLALTAALQLPFVRLVARTVTLDEIGRMSLADGGAEVLLTRAADYPAFNRWLGMKFDALLDDSTVTR
ncbi:nucleoside hydrolase [Crossiella sp. CA-258035]|uniref:nucleoside hydrolase n=1 Tax=Crossiella sp. CA-258035 TaxID=2981138 RepID=UPI0024BD04EF|nr:nucleoside hydrolase [Crossiella sp. CA-258035]WHT18929.1 nucleoside hydrolase [Crossiella sp. CA-258035]